MPAISVIIPVYKAEKHLDACLSSVVSQTFEDIEVLLVDDGSPDRCPELCDRWAERDSRIRVLHRPNGGAAAARNAGIDAATGRFLAFVDADDRLKPDALQRAYEAQQANHADLVIFNLQYVDEKGIPLAKPDFSGMPDEILDEDGVWNRYFSTGERCIYYVVVWNKLYKAALFQTLRFPEGKRYEDQFYMPGLYGQCRVIACLSYAGYEYVQWEQSTMARQGSGRNYLERSEYLIQWCDYFAGKGNYARAEGLLNDAIQNLSEKERFDLSAPEQQIRYREDCKACSAAYVRLARRTGQRSMWLRAGLLRLGLPVYLKFLQSRREARG